MRRAIALAMLLLITTFAPVAANQTGDDAFAEWAEQNHCEYFEQTGKYLCFGFKDYWHDHGGLEIFGYPISNEMQEDGTIVQYFERARFEWHPGVWPERHDVLQGLLGVEVSMHMDDHDAFDSVDKAKGDCAYFSATGHNVCDEFLKRWEMSGGLPVFGYPISEAFVNDEGMLVQYFERQRMEHQPGVWPERHDVLLGLLGSEVYSADVEPEPEPQPELTVVADDLIQPRGLLTIDDGLYVAEAGVGGDVCITVEEEFEGEVEEYEMCAGLTGSVIHVQDGEQSVVADGLPSLDLGGESSGPHDVAIDAEGNMYVAIGLGGTPEFRDEFGATGELMGTIVRVDDEGDFEVIADLAQYEADENPEDSMVDSNPYSIAFDGDELIAVDAGGNSLLRVDTEDGSIETVAIFEPRMVEAPPFLGAPEGTMIPMDSVPTNVVVGPDGNYYVSELTGFPFPVGGANIYQVTSDGDVSVYADNFTNLGDLAFDSTGDLYALEMLSQGLLAADEEAVFGEGDFSSIVSRIVRIEEDGTQTDLMIPGIYFATGIAIGEDDEIYVSNMAVTPDAHVLRIDLP